MESDRLIWLYSSVTLPHPRPRPALWGVSLSLVHDGELTRTSFSEAQVGVWLFISHLLIAAHTHTHAHAHADSLSPGCWSLAPHPHPPVIFQPIKTWFSVPEERGWHVIWSSIWSLFQCTSIRRTAGLQIIMTYIVDDFSDELIHCLVDEMLKVMSSHVWPTHQNLVH